MQKKHTISIFVFGAFLFFSLHGFKFGYAADISGPLDSNKDGIVSTKEFGTAFPGYEAADINMDGVVDHTELETVHAERGIGVGYGHVDTNKDGVMDHNELEAQHTSGLGKDVTETTHIGKSSSAGGIGGHGSEKSDAGGHSGGGGNDGGGGHEGGGGNGGSESGGGGNDGGGGHGGGKE